MIFRQYLRYHGRFQISALAIFLSSLLGSFDAPQLRAQVPSGQVAAVPPDLDQVRKFYREGKYEECIEAAQKEVARGVWNEWWPRLLIEGYLATGKYEEAIPEYEAAIQKFQTSVRLRLLGLHIYRMNNQPDKGAANLKVIPELMERMPWRFSGKDELVPLGEFFVLQGEDPKQVLEICYDRVLKVDPKMVEAHIASARLALEKHDDQVAVQSLTKALKLDETDPEIHMLLAKAWGNSDAEKATVHLRRALEINPRHVPSLLLQAENRMGAEDYEGAEVFLKMIEGVNPKLPKLWALRAAIAHLEGKHKEEGEYRRKGLAPWGLNPEVDYTIGKQLSEHYRFEEAIQYETRAVEMDSNFVLAKSQLAQDLLRFGASTEGWKLVDQVRQADPYDVSIFNLKQLESQLSKFETLEVPGFVVRMDARESRIYGDDVLALLSEARRVLVEKYEVKLEEPIYVEIFPRQKDFAIRTFGMPGGAGFLGVCFGRLITANSPAALKVDSNWKSVLWHEYCHVITLQKTKNKMPRWLSEGISVYEERLRDPRWGQSMDPTYRKMILSKDLVPVSRLSAAFMQPKTPMHLQFAYYESSMVVEYWIERYGLPSLRRVLTDLSVGMPIHEAFARDSGGIQALDKEFEEYIIAKANAFGAKKGRSGEDVFGTDDLPESEDIAVWMEWIEDHPTNYWGMRNICEALIASKRWDQALEWIQKLVDLYPEDSSSEGVYSMLASVHKEMGNLEEERKAWIELSKRSADSREALMRLIEIDSSKKEWQDVARWCEAMVEIDPLRPNVQETRAIAQENLQRPRASAASLKAVLEMDPVDPAGIHYRLARILRDLGDNQQAKRHVLQALEESPRYRDALQLLLAFQSGNDRTDQNQSAERESSLSPNRSNPSSSLHLPVRPPTVDPFQEEESSNQSDTSNSQRKDGQ